MMSESTNLERLDEIQTSHLEQAKTSHSRKLAEHWRKVFSEKFRPEAKDNVEKFFDYLEHVQTDNFSSLTQEIHNRVADKLEQKGQRVRPESTIKEACGTTFLIRHELVRAFLEATAREKEELSYERNLAISCHLLFTFADIEAGAVFLNHIPESHLVLAELFGAVSESSAKNPHLLEEAIQIKDRLARKRKKLLSQSGLDAGYDQALKEVADRSLWGITKGLRTEVIAFNMFSYVISDGKSELKKKFPKGSLGVRQQSIALKRSTARDDAEHDIDFYLVGRIGNEEVILAGIDVTTEDKFKNNRDITAYADEPDYTANILTVQRKENGEVIFDGDDSDKPLLAKTFDWSKETGIPVVGIRVPGFLLEKNLGVDDSGRKDLKGLARGNYGLPEQKRGIKDSLDMLDYALALRVGERVGRLIQERKEAA